MKRLKLDFATLYPIRLLTCCPTSFLPAGCKSSGWKSYVGRLARERKKTTNGVSGDGCFGSAPTQGFVESLLLKRATSSSCGSQSCGDGVKDYQGTVRGSDFYATHQSTVARPAATGDWCQTHWTHQAGFSTRTEASGRQTMKAYTDAEPAI